jgi:hypothetical protein
MFLSHFKKSAIAVLGAGVVSLVMVGCGTDGASDVGNVPVPGDKVTITATNADKVLASTVGGVGKIAGMINDMMDRLPGLSKTRTSYAVASSTESLSVPGKISLSLVSRNCAEAGNVEVKLDGSVEFNGCSERGVVLDGTAIVSVSNSSKYDIRFTNLNAAFSTGTLFISDAGVSVDGSNFTFKIETGTATVQGIGIEVKNYTITRDASGTIVTGSIKTACMGGWADVTTAVPLRYNASKVLTGGVLVVSGNASEMHISVNADGSIDVTLNGSDYAHYPSASDLPQYNAVCP